MKFFLITFGLPSGAQSGHDLACGFKTLEAYTDKCCGFGSIRIWMNTSDPDLNMNTDQWLKKKYIMFCLVKPNSWIRICIEKSWIWINNRPMLIAESIEKKLWVTHHKKNNVCLCYFRAHSSCQCSLHCEGWPRPPFHPWAQAGSSGSQVRRV